MGYAKENAEPGAQINIKLTNKSIINANVVNMPFYDPENKRQKM